MYYEKNTNLYFSQNIILYILNYSQIHVVLLSNYDFVFQQMSGRSKSLSGPRTRPHSTSRISQGYSAHSNLSSGGTSPTKTETKKLPPIKAPVGLARGPDLKNVRSKIGSLDNVRHRPTGGERRVETQKLEWNAKSRVGSLENAQHRAHGGNVKVIYSVWQ